MNAQWQSIHIYYYDVNKDNLLLDCVRPLFKTLRERGWTEHLYFVRHWHGGSHLRLHIAAAPLLFQQKIAPYIQNEVECYLLQNPATTSFSEKDARSQYERRESYNTHQYVTLRPNNSLEIAPYEDLAPTVGSQGAARLLETYYEETCDAAFALIEQTRNNYTARLNACFDQLVAIVATSPFLPLDRAYMSYRSHAEGFIIGEPETEEPRLRRQRLEAAYQQRSTAINQRLRHLLALFTKAPERLPAWLTEIVELHRRYGQQTYKAAQDGTFELKKHKDTEQARQRMRLEESNYLATAFSSPAVLDYIDSPIVVAHRTVLNLLYLHLHRVGMLNEDRYILDYYIASALEELLGIDPLASMRAS
jgi:hypothetical protein